MGLGWLRWARAHRRQRVDRQLGRATERLDVHHHACFGDRLGQSDPGRVPIAAGKLIQVVAGSACEIGELVLFFNSQLSQGGK